VTTDDHGRPWVSIDAKGCRGEAVAASIAPVSFHRHHFHRSCPHVDARNCFALDERHDGDDSAERSIMATATAMAGRMFDGNCFAPTSRPLAAIMDADDTIQRPSIDPTDSADWMHIICEICGELRSQTATLT
jgi:hypothetical protein